MEDNNILSSYNLAKIEIEGIYRGIKGYDTSLEINRLKEKIDEDIRLGYKESGEEISRRMDRMLYLREKRETDSNSTLNSYAYFNYEISIKPASNGYGISFKDRNFGIGVHNIRSIENIYGFPQGYISKIYLQENEVYGDTFCNEFQTEDFKVAVKAMNLIVKLLEWKNSKRNMLNKDTFNLDNFKNGNIVVNCDTIEKSKNFLKFINKFNLRWVDESNLLECDMWNHKKYSTCYKFINTWFKYGVSYTSINKSIGDGSQIYKWETIE